MIEMGRIFGGAIKGAISRKKKTGCHKGHFFWFTKLSNYQPYLKNQKELGDKVQTI